MSNAEDRFCTHMPHSNLPCEPLKRQSEAAGHVAVGFKDSVSRLEATVGQASIRINDKLRTLQTRCANGAAELPRAQLRELCGIADGIATAAYHVQKWAHAYKAPSQPSKPTKPPRSADFQQALSCIRFAIPRLICGANEVFKAVSADFFSARKAAAEQRRQAEAEAHESGRRGQEEMDDEVDYAEAEAQERAQADAAAEAHATSISAPPDDIRALAPHLEHFLAQLISLCANAKPRKLRDFVKDYFAPSIGQRPASLVAWFLDG
jgi:hypothetical protein